MSSRLSESSVNLHLVFQSVFGDDVQVDEVPHGGPAVGTVPWVLNLPHVDQELPHLADTQGSADHHLWISTSQLT